MTQILLSPWISVNIPFFSSSLLFVLLTDRLTKCKVDIKYLQDNFQWLLVARISKGWLSLPSPTWPPHHQLFSLPMYTLHMLNVQCRLDSNYQAPGVNIQALWKGQCAGESPRRRPLGVLDRWATNGTGRLISSQHNKKEYQQNIPGG